MKTCALAGCGEPTTKRGKTCSPEHAYQFRHGKAESSAQDQVDPKESQEFKDDKWTVSLDATRIKSLDELVEHCKVDLRVWEVERFVANKWESAAKLGDSTVTVTPLFQVKAWFKKRKQVDFALREIEELRKSASADPRLIPVKYKSSNSGNIVEISTPDLHAGKLAWAGETGHDDWDTKKALSAFEEAMDTMIGRSIQHCPERFVFVVGHDALQVDRRSGTTTSGTVVDADSRYHKVFGKLRDAVISRIEQMRQIAPVDVVTASGNHDGESAWHMVDSVRCWFRNDSNVTVENAPTPRKYYEWGKTMLMFTHGHQGKRADYGLLMASEQPEMWGRTKYREIHTGHLHGVKAEEKHGIVVRILPSLSGTDYWHSSNGYTGNIRRSEAYVWNKQEGLIAQHYFTLQGKK